jgi:hypothetical protein
MSLRIAVTGSDRTRVPVILAISVSDLPGPTREAARPADGRADRLHPRPGRTDGRPQHPSARHRFGQAPHPMSVPGRASANPQSPPEFAGSPPSRAHRPTTELNLSSRPDHSGGTRHRRLP